MHLYRIFSDDEARELVKEIKRYEWVEGKASTKEATGRVKRNSEIQWFEGGGQREILKRIHERLSASPLMGDHMIRHLMVPKLNRYGVGEMYGDHADAGLMGGKLRTDLACTLSLNENYKGGELVIDGHPLRLEAGMCVVYECWKPHRVNEVYDGERISAITWGQSWVRDKGQRDVLAMMRSVLSDVDRSSEEERLYPRLSAVYGKLVRFWSDATEFRND